MNGGGWEQPPADTLDTFLSWVNVMDHGARGDGVTDDAAAINAAIASLPSTGGVVYFPSPLRFYYIKTGIVDPGIPNVTLLGADGAPFAVSGVTGPPQTLSACAIGSDQAIVMLTIGSAASSDWRGWRVENLTLFDSSPGHNVVLGGLLLNRRNMCKFVNLSIFDIGAGYGVTQTGVVGNPQYTEFDCLRVYGCKFGLIQATKASDTHIRRSTLYGVNAGVAVVAGSIGVQLDSSTTIDEETSIQFYETAIKVVGEGRCNRINGHVEASVGNPGLVAVDITVGNDNLVNTRIANTWSTAKIRIAAGVLRTGITNLVTESDTLTAGNTIVDAGTSTYLIGALTGLDMGDNAVAFSARSVAASTALSNRYFTALVDASGGTRTITLPDATTRKGRLYLIKRVDATPTTNVTIATTSGQTIDGLAGMILYLKNDFVLVQSDGANWNVLGASTSPAAMAFAPQLPAYLGPDPRLAFSASAAVSAINAARGTRRLVPMTGHITDVSILVNVQSGNIDVGIFDTAATNRTLLWHTGSIASPANTGWISVGNPNLAVNRGDQLDFAIAADNTTFKIVTNNFSGLAAQLPITYWPAPKGGIPNLTWAKTALFPLANVAESALGTASSVELAIIALVTPA